MSGIKERKRNIELQPFPPSSTDKLLCVNQMQISSQRILFVSIYEDYEDFHSVILKQIINSFIATITCTIHGSNLEHWLLVVDRGGSFFFLSLEIWFALSTERQWKITMAISQATRDRQITLMPLPLKWRLIENIKIYSQNSQLLPTQFHTFNILFLWSTMKKGNDGGEKALDLLCVFTRYILLHVTKLRWNWNLILWIICRLDEKPK